MRGERLAGLALATVCGVATAYTTLQPALKEEAEKKAGTFNARHEQDRTAKDTQLSRAIISDLEEAKREFVGGDKGNGGFAWGIRRWLAGEEDNKRNEK